MSRLLSDAAGRHVSAGSVADSSRDEMPICSVTVGSPLFANLYGRQNARRSRSVWLILTRCFALGTDDVRSAIKKSPI
jgi:hypothetical protein